MTQARRNGLARVELECMQVLWRQPGATVAEVRAGLGRPLAYTTVMTVLDRMAAKGVVERQKKNRAYVYSARLGLEAARRQAVDDVVQRLFGGDRQALARYLAGERPQPERPLAVARARMRKPAAPPPRSDIDDSLL